jgi:hypothetical protein
MTTKMITSIFGATHFNTGRVTAGQPVNPATTVDFLPGAQKYGTPVHDDVFYSFSPALGNRNGGMYITYDQHDLRDLLTEGKAMKNAMINIQRMKETPITIECFNVPPQRAIFETIIVTNSTLNFQEGELGINPRTLFKAGFGAAFATNSNQGKLDDNREILYCERRVYGQDRSQEFKSPDEMGTMFGGPPIGTSETRWLNSWLLLDRTVCGQANMVIGPNLQVIRFIEVDVENRDNQNTSTTVPPEPAREYLDQQFSVNIAMPAIEVNIIGDMMPLTATEKATEYTNVFLSNQNPPSA